MKVVGFVGPKHSGKDTCALIAKKQKRLKTSVSFALPLKRICSEVFQISMNYFTDQDLKEKPFKEPVKVTVKHLRAIKEAMTEYVDPAGEGTYYNPNKATSKLVGTLFKTPRQILQVIGTEFIRDEIHEDWHCMAAFSEKNLKIVLGKRDNVVVAVTDCRFANEFNFLSRKFGEDLKFFYVERPSAEEVLAEATHRSETGVLEVKELLLANGGEVIDNSGSLQDLEDTVKGLNLPKKATGKAAKEGKPEPGSRFRWGLRGA